MQSVFLQSINSFNKRIHFAILATTWTILQGLLIHKFGIVTGFEATKYIDQAQLLLTTGEYSYNSFIFYSTQILLIAACKQLQIGYWPIIVLQLICNAFSLYCFYKLINKLTGKINVAFCFSLLLVIMYYYQLYNVYLFTESLYFSFSIIFFYVLLQLRKANVQSVILVLIGLSILYLTRPMGIFFIPATFLFFVFRFFPKKAALILSTSGVLFFILFYYVLNASLNSGGEFDFQLPYVYEIIICGVPTTNAPRKIGVPVEKNSVEGLLYIIIHNHKLFLFLSVKRMFAFFGVVRSYYSPLHNIYIGAYFYSIYILILIGVRKWKRTDKPKIAFILCVIFFTTLTTALSCDEWHNRFIYAILPFLLILAALAFIGPLPKIKSNVEEEFE